MRIRRTILAPTILAIGTAGALIAAPAIAITAPAGAASPNLMNHASGPLSPNLMIHP